MGETVRAHRLAYDAVARCRQTSWLPCVNQFGFLPDSLSGCEHNQSHGVTQLDRAANCSSLLQQAVFIENVQNQTNYFRLRCELERTFCRVFQGEPGQAGINLPSLFGRTLGLSTHSLNVAKAHRDIWLHHVKNAFGAGSWLAVFESD